VATRELVLESNEAKQQEEQRHFLPRLLVLSTEKNSALSPRPEIVHRAEMGVLSPSGPFFMELLRRHQPN
jgi:hypothetical protein